MEIKQIKNIESELKRFTERLKQCKQRVEKDGGRTYCSRETGALKRAALDFKQVLTKELKNEY